MKKLQNILAFLNLLEGRRTRISISHVMMWVSIWVVAHMTINSPEYLAEALTALGVSTANYVAKRYIHRGAE